MNIGEFNIIAEVAVKCNDISRNTKEKSVEGHIVDVKPRKPEEQKGLDTPVVLAVNDVD